MPLGQLSQGPSALLLEVLQCGQWLSMANVKFSEDAWNSTSGTIFLKKRTSKFDALEILDGGCCKDLRRVCKDGLGVYQIDRYVLQSQSVGSNLPSHQQLTTILGEGVHCCWMGWNEADSGEGHAICYVIHIGSWNSIKDSSSAVCIFFCDGLSFWI